MTELSDHDRQALADLATLPSYMLLLGILRQYEDAVLDELARASNDAARIQHGRFYQFLTRMRQMLATVPANAAAELDSIRALDTADVGPTGDRDQLWAQRFSGHNTDQA